MKRRHADSVPSRMLTYFETNPAEELTAKDAAIKFSCGIQCIWDAVHRLKKDGEVEAMYVIRRPEAKR